MKYNKNNMSKSPVRDKMLVENDCHNPANKGACPLVSMIFLLAALTFAGCEDVMNKKDLGSLVAEDVWDDPNLVKQYMDNIITAMPGPAAGDAKRCDEGWGIYDGAELFDNYNIDGGDGMLDSWKYENIRNINKFFENVDKCKTLDEKLKKSYIAQLLVMRAWLYFTMVRAYGGVPLVLNEQKLGDDLFVKREKTSVCIAQIIKDLDDAIATADESFPWIWADEADKGRISKAIAVGLKGRILLYYASPQFAKETPAGTKSVAERWTDAYNATKTAKEQLAANGFGLFRPEPASFDEAVQNYYDLFVGNEMNREMLWVRRYSTLSGLGSDWDKVYRPTSSQGTGGASAGCTLEMANAFLNADGTPYTGLTIPAGGGQLDKAMEESTAAYWLGREPRFYATVAYNGCVWNLERINNTAGETHQWTFRYGTSPYDDAGTTFNGGFRIRKMVDVSVNYSNGTNGTDWPLMRYAEILLNFAEAAAKTGHADEAIQVLKDIRKRAGIPAGSNGNYGLPAGLTGDALTMAIVKERRLELAFEGFRFYDLRRWRLFTDELEGFKLNGTYRHTIKPTYTAGIENLDKNLLLNLDVDANPADYFNVFTDEVCSVDANPIAFTERLYFLRIAYQTHIRVNTNLEQTKGWGSGTFDPYE